MQFLLHDHEVNENLVHVFVGIVTDCFKQAPKGVLYGPGGRAVAVGFYCGQVQDVFPLQALSLGRRLRILLLG